MGLLDYYRGGQAVDEAVAVTKGQLCAALAAETQTNAALLVQIAELQQTSAAFKTLKRERFQQQQKIATLESEIKRRSHLPGCFAIFADLSDSVRAYCSGQRS